MREIKFRARNKETGNWEYGSSTISYESGSLASLCEFWGWVRTGVLDPETVGEYTSRKDKNGKEIYEGDRVEIECECGYKDKMPVEWGWNGYRLKQTYSHTFPSGELELARTERTEVIGNIYKNPEVIKDKVT